MIEGRYDRKCNEIRVCQFGFQDIAPREYNKANGNIGSDTTRYVFSHDIDSFVPPLTLFCTSLHRAIIRAALHAREGDADGYEKAVNAPDTLNCTDQSRCIRSPGLK